MSDNIERDARIEEALRRLDWRVFVVWECQLKLAKIDQTVEDLAARIDCDSVSGVCAACGDG